MTDTHDECHHCSHYKWVNGQLFDTAIALEVAEEELHRIRPRLGQAADALTWCLAHIDPKQVPGWVRSAFEEVSV